MRRFRGLGPWQHPMSGPRRSRQHGRSRSRQLDGADDHLWRAADGCVRSHGNEGWAQPICPARDGRESTERRVPAVINHRSIRQRSAGFGIPSVREEAGIRRAVAHSATSCLRLFRVERVVHHARASFREVIPTRHLRSPISIRERSQARRGCPPCALPGCGT